MIAPYKVTNAAGVEETKYKLEIDSISVRNELKVYTFVVSQLLGENDNRIFAGMMEVDHYDPETRPDLPGYRRGQVVQPVPGR